jgi:DNA-binding NarL/FixJ family response regulator
LYIVDEHSLYSVASRLPWQNKNRYVAQTSFLSNLLYTPLMKKVAIIEDHTAVRDMVAQIVQTKEDWEIVASLGDGRLALDTCIETKPDFIILDIMLPGLNGAEILRRLKRHLPDSFVLVFSGYQDASILREMVEAGAHGFIGKTAPLSELQKGLEIVSTGGTYFSPEVAEILRQTMSNPQQGGPGPLQRLTAREREILQLIAESNSTKEIANILQISVKTAENHRTNLMRKLDLHDVASLTRFAIEFGIIEPPNRGPQGM